MVYQEIYGRLNFEAATIVFMKKNGDVRVLFGTRSLGIMNINNDGSTRTLGGRDNNCNITNGNIAVYDMIIGESRVFNIDRLVSVDWHGELKNQRDLDTAIETFANFKKEYEKNNNMEINMDNL